MVGESVTNLKDIPAECLDRSQTGSRTIPSAFDGKRSKYLKVSAHPFPSTPISFALYQSISSLKNELLCANKLGEKPKVITPPRI